jgi:hypothetical protein
MSKRRRKTSALDPHIGQEELCKEGESKSSKGINC